MYSNKEKQSYLLANYATAPFDIIKGEGSFVWDEEGNRYLDFASGIAVNTLGHCNKEFISKVTEQLSTVIHCSNLFGIPQQRDLAEKLVKKIAPGKMLFCNSGAEANEALIKLARLFGKEKSGKEGQQFHIICAENAFHGRTFGGMSATPQEKVQKGFGPLLDGFSFGKMNDIDSFRKLITDKTAAIMIESIQGEGGIHTAKISFLKELRALCDEHSIMLILDEVQCGIGRTGNFLAYQKAGIIPDAIGLAKGLGGGFPIGAIWVKEDISHLFTPGSHGTTFGGSPLACSAALAVLNEMDRLKLMDHVNKVSLPFWENLNALKEDFDFIEDIRGEGLMVGIVCKDSPATLISLLRNSMLLTVPAGGNVIRLLPPLNVTVKQLEMAIETIRRTLTLINQK
jgi:acetylornithine aminotransferase/acetylornithine/N-succinyldiaminopimelate aminotransferase